jgi:hypothetical protein
MLSARISQFQERYRPGCADPARPNRVGKDGGARVWGQKSRELTGKTGETAENGPKMTENGQNSTKNGQEMTQNGPKMTQNGRNSAKNGPETEGNWGDLGIFGGNSTEIVRVLPFFFLWKNNNYHRFHIKNTHCPMKNIHSHVKNTHFHIKNTHFPMKNTHFPMENAPKMPQNAPSPRRNLHFPAKNAVKNKRVQKSQRRRKRKLKFWGGILIRVKVVF